MLYPFNKEKKRPDFDGRRIERLSGQTILCGIDQHWLVYALEDDGSTTEWKGYSNYCSVQSCSFRENEPVGTFLVDQVLAAD